MSTLRLCWQLRAHQAMPNTTTKRTAARMAMRWMRVRRRSGRRRDEGAEGGPPASAGARLVVVVEEIHPADPPFSGGWWARGDLNPHERKLTRP